MSNIISVSHDGALLSSPYFLAILAIVVGTLFRNLFFAPSTLYRSGSPIKPYKNALFPAIGPFTLYQTRNAFLRKVFGDPENWDSVPPKQIGVRTNSCNRIMTIINNPANDGKTFFNDRSLNLSTAYEIMFAGVPQLPSWLATTKPAEDSDNPSILNNLKAATNSKRLQYNIPQMVHLAADLFTSLAATNGQIDVHKTIYPLVFQFSILFVGLAEHARDINAVRRIEAPFWTFADNVGFMATHFPLLPIPSTVKKWYGAIRMSTEIRITLKKRKAEGRREDDYIQEMIDNGASDSAIDAFIMGGLFAAIINTTGVTSYFLIFVLSDPVLRDKIRAELEAVFRKDAEQRGDDYDALTIQEKLGRASLETWEAELPTYQNALDETLRLLLISLIFRRKLKADSKATHVETEISGDRIPDGEFVGFWLASAHRNSNIYKDPLRFDPSRFDRGEGRGEGEFVPWGAGRHICLGMRFAKLEFRVVHAVFLLTFSDARSVDAAGNPYSSLTVPLPDQESEHRRYPTKPVTLAYNTNLLAKNAAASS